MRVLIVDESAEQAELLRKGLQQAGFEVAASLSAPSGLLKTIQELRPDIIMIDTASAVARFEEIRGLQSQLAEANQKLSERKVVERAKGLLMKSKQLDEEAAYSALRKMAMDRKLKLAEVARRVVDAADLLGA